MTIRLRLKRVIQVRPEMRIRQFFNREAIPCRLGGGHDLQRFDCGDYDALDLWIVMEDLLNDVANPE